VQEAITVSKPYAVDVCSGVETRPGKKDLRRMRSFLQAAKSPTKTTVALTGKRSSKAKAERRG